LRFVADTFHDKSISCMSASVEMPNLMTISQTMATSVIFHENRPVLYEKSQTNERNERTNERTNQQTDTRDYIPL